MDWTEPHMCMQHLGPLPGGKHWATVCNREGWAELTCWFPGCGPDPIVSKHADAAQARAAGEAWMRDMPV